MTEKRTKREAAVTELKQIYRMLFDDVAQAEEIFSLTPSDFANRTLVRTYFAYVEGVANLLRQVTLASLDGLGFLTANETATLKDQRYKQQDNGETKLVPAFQGMADSLKFTLRCYAKNHGINDYEPKLGSGWQSMLTAIRIRDRLMHPKSVVSLTLTQAEIDNIDEARKWWHESVQELLSACEQEDQRLLRKLNNPE
jgi:hypothetical protein